MALGAEWMSDYAYGQSDLRNDHDEAAANLARQRTIELFGTHLG